MWAYCFASGDESTIGFSVVAIPTNQSVVVWNPWT